MYPEHKHPFQSLAGWGLILLAGPLLWWDSLRTLEPAVNGAVFASLHTLLELASVVVAMLVFVTGYRAIFSIRKGALVLLGIGYFGVGLLDFFHAINLSLRSTAETGHPLHAADPLWQAASVLSIGSLFLYALLPPGPEASTARKRAALGLMFVLVAGLAFLTLPRTGDLSTVHALHPEVPAPPRLEWVLILSCAVTLAILWRRRQQLIQECVMALLFAVALAALSQFFSLAWSRTSRDEDSAIAHFYQLASYLFLLHVTFHESLRRPLERMAAQHTRERLILSTAPDGVFLTNQTGTILMANPAMEHLTGYAVDELLGQNVDIFLPQAMRAHHAESIRKFFTKPHSRAMGSMDLRLQRRSGESISVDISLGYWANEGERYAVAYIRDLSERKKFEESLQHQATHDSLTGLPNRLQFGLQLDQAVSRANRNGMRLAVLFLDLDYFKNINDSFGHAAGDALLIQVGKRIRALLREHDVLSRLGGDEFALLLGDLSGKEDAMKVAAKLLVALQAAYRIGGQDVYTGGSLGIAFYPDDARDSETLLRYADMAMYQAKHAGRGTYACYSQDMDLKVQEDMQLHTRLKEAIAANALELYYQPQVDVETGRVVGVEALLRWFDRELGAVSPDRFIPVAEATGLILPLSEWVLNTACRQIAAWQRRGMPLRVAVNISAQLLALRNLSELVQATLLRTGADADLLDIEITESLAMQQPDHAREQLMALVGLGCRIVLDDFGTGYSSLAYLKALPVKKLKIDQSFIQGVPNDSNDTTISKAIIALAHSLGMTLIAEGVETEAQLDFLRQFRCETYQGWLFARAMKATDIEALLHCPEDCI